MIDGGFLLMLAAAAALLIEPAFGRVQYRRGASSRPVIRRILQSSFPILPLPADYQDLAETAGRTLDRDAMRAGTRAVSPGDAIIG